MAHIRKRLSIMVLFVIFRSPSVFLTHTVNWNIEQQNDYGRLPLVARSMVMDV